MAFPTSTQIAQTAVAELLSWARSLRSDAAKYISQCDGGSLQLHDVASGFLDRHLARAKTGIAVLASVPGIFDALVEQLPNKFVDAAAAQAAVNDVVAAVDDMILFLEANIPVDSERRILSLVLSDDGSGTLSQRSITAPAGLSAFRAQLVTFRDAFEA